MKTLFQAIGYRLGQGAARAKSVLDLLGGEEEESLRAEVRLGRDLAAALLERTPLVEESAGTRFVADIGRWLAGHLKEKRLPFTFRITAEPGPTACALPGGAVFVSQPLVDLCQGQRDEIAFVLAHEIAHIVRRHALDRIVRDSVFSLLLRRATGGRAATAWLGQVSQRILSQAYSREQELEADALALSLIRACGGDLLAGERLLDKLARATASQSPTLSGEYFATHPPLPERLAHLRAWRERPTDRSRLETNSLRSR
jgi:beta-barrel assembly-enhancing protease